jgi:DNA-binding response OmpR family regulator
MKNKATILYVEDDLTLSFVTRENLELRGYEIDAVDNGRDALRKFTERKYDLCILDVMLPGMDGFSLAEHIRKADDEIPIIFLTARSTKEDKIFGLRLGADDYITKPFSIEELVLKIDVFLKRRRVDAVQHAEGIIRLTDDIFYDSGNLALKSGNRTHKLTHREGDLLELLLENRNKILKREEILQKVWGHDHFFSSRSLDVFISRLRKYLGDQGTLIENVYNVGYRLRT